MKLAFLALTIVAASALLAGCGSKDDEVITTPTNSSKASVAPGKIGDTSTGAGGGGAPAPQGATPTPL